MQLSDLTLGTRTHWVYDRWVEEAFKKKFMGFDPRGRLRWVALYYDPLLDRVHGDRRVLGLFPSIYVVPQNRELGELLYRSAVASVGWDKRWLPVLHMGPDPRPLTLGFLMAREYGDHTTALRLGKKLESLSNARFFDAGGGPDADEYGHFFRYGERYPRGQESALYMLKDLLEDEGEWGRAFCEPDDEKFAAPTATDAEYPKLGFSVAWNDPERGVLQLESFVATSSARGDATRFCVRNLPDAHGVRVRRDDRAHAAWRALDSHAIEVETAVGDHRFEIATGYRGSQAIRPGAAGAKATSHAPVGAIARARTTVAEILTASSTVAVGCPCCAGAA